MYRYMYRSGVLGSIDIVATISKPKSATICYLIFAFEQWFQSLSLIRVFGYIEAATTITTSSSSSNIITKHEKKTPEQHQMLMENGSQLLLRIKCDHLYQFKHKQMSEYKYACKQQAAKVKARFPSTRANARELETVEAP